jgi:hypothetical protein
MQECTRCPGAAYLPRGPEARKAESRLPKGPAPEARGQVARNRTKLDRKASMHPAARLPTGTARPVPALTPSRQSRRGSVNRIVQSPAKPGGVRSDIISSKELSDFIGYSLKQLPEGLALERRLVASIWNTR